jgi:hypothetical protein
MRCRKPQARMLLPILTLIGLFVTSAAMADEVEGTAEARQTHKPSAPIAVRWLDDGRDGKVTIELVAGVDTVGAELRLVLADGQRPLTARLPAAVSGEKQIVDWVLDRPAVTAPRLLIELDTGDRLIAGTAVAPRSRSKRAGSLPRPLPELRPEVLQGQPASSQDDAGLAEDDIVELPAEQTIRRQQD